MKGDSKKNLYLYRYLRYLKLWKIGDEIALLKTNLPVDSIRIELINLSVI